MGESPAIIIENLTKSYKLGLFKRPRKALNGLNLYVNKREVFGFLGPNGAGKTTTIKLLLNFIHPDSGRIEVLGCPVSDATIRSKIGYLPETAQYYPFLTPKQTLQLYARTFNLDKNVVGERIKKLIPRVGLAGRENDKLSTFSKGMLQRVGIAQALLNEPELMILDEPASGLDPLGQKEIRDVILECKERGTTIFFSSHQLSEIETVCDRAAIIYNGEILKQGTLAELLPYSERYAVKVRGIEPGVLEKMPELVEKISASRFEEVTFITRHHLTPSQIVSALQPTSAEILEIKKVRLNLEDAFLEIIAQYKKNQSTRGDNQCET